MTTFLRAWTRASAAILLLLCIGAGYAGGAAGPPDDPIHRFDTQVAMVPMRDGTRLHTVIYTPRDNAEDLPVLFWRSPYDVSRVGAASPAGSIFHTGLRDLVEDGYIFVFQDIRGRHGSEGEFTMLRPSRDRSDPRSIDESTDAYDSIEWLIDNLPSHNGRVGMLGVSYPAWLAVMAAIDPHPALAAISPQASPADVYIGDDFFHNGAFRLSYGFEYVAFMERDSGADVFDFGMEDTYDWYLQLGSLRHVKQRFLADTKTTWDDFVAHPDYDEFWRARAVISQLGKIRVPSLTVGGWYDVEDGYGPYRLYQAWQDGDHSGMNHLVIGPWTHGLWLWDDGSNVGKLDFESATASYFRREIMAPWFARQLKDKGNPDTAPVQLFQTGANRWQQFDEWPASGTVERRLYLGAQGRLSFTPPNADQDMAVDSYISNPADPVPYRPRPIGHMFAGPDWGQWLMQDQRFLAGRDDVVSWVSAPLEVDIALSGNIISHLFAATTGSDADWVVKLIDVYPENYPADPTMNNYQLIVAGEILRARYRNGLESAEPVEPGKAEEYRIDLQPRHHLFRKGHRIMVQVQSSWFPLFDRNPQTFVDNIFAAQDRDFRAATHTIHRSHRFPSHVRMQTLP